MADPTVVAACVLSVPATISGFAAWRTASKTHAEVKTNHGLRQGDYVELTAMVVGELKTAFVEHVAVDKSSFDSLTAGQAQLTAGQERIAAEQARVAEQLARKLEP